MKKLAVTYTYHKHLSSPKALESVAHFEVEDDVAVEKSFEFVAVKSTHQRHIAMIVY